MTTNSDHQNPFRLRHEHDKLFTSSRLSKESSKSNPSFRAVYYGDVSSTVPFTWESTPGTPKHKSSENPNIPPLTPPPSYFTTNLNNSSKNHSRSKLLFNNLLRRMNPTKKSRLGVSSPHSSSFSSLSWSSSAHSSFSDAVPSNCVRKRRRFSSWGSSFDAKSDVINPRGCFGIGKGSGERSRNGYSVLIVKKALLSIVGRGSSA
ncbi:hypothetical protein CASFOL_000576 [Castilleja foliolosa]|uniref:Uncharacterized protein n=1 Tax=Castilleja foliolosa TaxID=1961234 RepID=A0ABD3ENV2_9LAMI